MGRTHKTPYADGHHRRKIEELRSFVLWLAREGVTGYIGEVGWSNGTGRPQDDRVPLWDDLAEAWYRAADAANLWATNWGVSERQLFGGFHLSSYRSVGDGTTRALSIAGRQASVIERHPETPWYRRGVNISSAEEIAAGFHSGNPGDYQPTTGSTGWWYFSQASLDYLFSRGVRTVRLPFRWERVQPTLGAAFDATLLSYLTDCIARCAAAGLKVILDNHNGAGFYNGTTTEAKLGGGVLTREHLADFWTRMSAAMKADATRDATVIAFDLMNEPNGMAAGAFASAAKQWEDASQHVVSALRTAGETRLLMVPGYNFSNARVWVQEHPRKWITDTTNNHRYTAHHYFPRFGDGQFNAGYTQEIANAALDGWYA